MSNNKMLIDATHPEETRVVVLRSGRVEEFDYESAARKLLRGNIYLAKVTRVEPSLQAAFVEYGGNRHGFLAFNEIHPDYYQIPMADRQALLDEEAEAEAREEAEVDAHAERLARRQRGRNGDRRRHRGGRGPGQEEQPRLSSSEDDGEPGDEAQPRTLAERVRSDDDVISEAAAAYDAGDETNERLADDASRETDDDASVASGSDENDGEDQDAEGRREDDDRPTGDDDDEDDEDLDEDDESDAEDRDGEDSQDAAADASRAAADGEAGHEGNVEVVAREPASGNGSEVETVEQVGVEDALEELPSRPRRRPRSYKIQEVIKRRQVILVQVVKEERGNKGAALTTYLSLAGRYTVLMPNTARGGGISRKITQPQDRKRLKAIAQELEVPEGMGLIIRTAGAARTKQEIKRDFEYLLRLWESVRDMTLQSTAPSLVYEEGNLIKRSIRDLYNKDVDEIIVAGDEAHRDARDFMRMLMPSHTKNVLQHSDPEPLFTRFGIERQLNAMFSPYVTLRSGGYLVINQTEALVAIDVNSGKSTREFSIEETALNTNLEASDEIARQLKLRDLAGLVVIDFIDMEEKRNNRAVERRLKDALRFDRARIQLGRISHFGLMEMSRQRMRTGVLEGSTSQCPHCQGTGIIRSTESVALAVLRGLEDALMAGARTSLIATTTATVALYLLNNKRPYINEMEARHGLTIAIQASDKLQGANFTIEKGQSVAQPQRRPDRSAAVNMDWGFEGEDQVEDEGPEEVEEAGTEARPRNGEDSSGGRRRRRRRRGRRGERDGADGRGDRGGSFEREASADDDSDDGAPADSFEDAESDAEAETGGEREAGSEPERRAEDSGEERSGRRRRRGRRGGRRGRDRDRGERATAEAAGGEASGDDLDDDGDGADDGGEFNGAPESGEDAGSSRHDVRSDRSADAEANMREAGAAPTDALAARAGDDDGGTRDIAAETEAPASLRARRSSGSSEPKVERLVVRPDALAVTEEPASADNAIEEPATARRGWWQRR